MKRIIGLFIIMLVALSSLNAQDFQCSVSINANQISSSGNQQRYNEMRQKLYTFVHDRKWCQYNLKQNERIECSITINLTKESGDEYEGTATLVLQRPVYKASYKTTLLSFQDKKVKFRYADGDPLEYDESTNLSDLTSLIAYYLNLFIAVELDSFSQNGGSPYFSKCQNIVNLNQKEVGWNVAESVTSMMSLSDNRAIIVAISTPEGTTRSEELTPDIGELKSDDLMFQHKEGKYRQYNPDSHNKVILGHKVTTYFSSAAVFPHSIDGVWDSPGTSP